MPVLAIGGDHSYGASRAGKLSGMALNVKGAVKKPTLFPLGPAPVRSIGLVSSTSRLLRIDFKAPYDEAHSG
jgi:hypothetical protein